MSEEDNECFRSPENYIMAIDGSEINLAISLHSYRIQYHEQHC